MAVCGSCWNSTASWRVAGLSGLYLKVKMRMPEHRFGHRPTANILNGRKK